MLNYIYNQFKKLLDTLSFKNIIDDDIIEDTNKQIEEELYGKDN